MLALARFALRDKSVMLLRKGWAHSRFHGRVAILVNQWTNSAGEMLASFASENRLATIVGTQNCRQCPRSCEPEESAPGTGSRARSSVGTRPTASAWKGRVSHQISRRTVDPPSWDAAIDQQAQRAAEVLDAT